MGVFQLWTTVLKFVPLALMATVGLLFIKAGNFTPWNTSGDTSLSAIGGAMAICLFSYLGVETAAVAAGKVRNPARNVAEVHDLRHPRQRRRLPALADRRLRDPARRRPRPGQQPGVVLRRSQPDRRRHLARLHRRPRRDHLRPRRTQRLDDDLRRDAARSRQGRAVPTRVRLAVRARRAGLRDHLLDRAGLGRRRDQLPGRQRRDRVHHPRPDDRHHLRHPVRRLGARPAQVAAAWTASAATPRASPWTSASRSSPW